MKVMHPVTRFIGRALVVIVGFCTVLVLALAAFLGLVGFMTLLGLGDTGPTTHDVGDEMSMQEFWMILKFLGIFGCSGIGVLVLLHFIFPFGQLFPKPPEKKADEVTAE